MGRPKKSRRTPDHETVQVYDSELPELHDSIAKLCDVSVDADVWREAFMTALEVMARGDERLARWVAREVSSAIAAGVARVELDLLRHHVWPKFEAQGFDAERAESAMELVTPRLADPLNPSTIQAAWREIQRALGRRATTLSDKLLAPRSELRANLNKAKPRVRASILVAAALDVDLSSLRQGLHRGKDPRRRGPRKTDRR